MNRHPRCTTRVTSHHKEMYIDADMTEMAQHQRKHDFSASHSTRAALVTSLGTQPVTSNSNKYHLPLVSPSTSHGHQYTSTAPYKQRRSLAASFVLSCGRGALLQESSAPGVWCVSKLELLCVDALCGMGIESLCRPGNVVEFSDECFYECNKGVVRHLSLSVTVPVPSMAQHLSLCIFQTALLNLIGVFTCYTWLMLSLSLFQIQSIISHVF